MDRVTKLSLLLLACPATACSDDIPELPTTSSSGDTTDGPTDPTLTGTTAPTSTSADDTTDGSTGSTDSTTDGPTSTTDPDESSSGPGPMCGNASVDPGEDCDGAELGGASCESLDLGFSGGTLACAADCTFDTSGCSTCGNDLVEGTEACDGTDLAGSDCASEGFVDGTLACAADCTFDTSACSSCGNDVIDGGEDCDGADLGGSGCADLGLGFTGGQLGCDAGCGFDTTACTSLPWPVAGELVITEIMQNPSVLADADGEWFEVYNPGMGVSYQLGSCFIDGNGVDAGFTVDTDLVIGPQEYRIFSTDSLVDQGFTPDHQWLDADFSLNNSADVVRVTCNGIIVDEVAYDGGPTFPDPTGQSMSLDPGSYDATANDVGTNWCAGTTSYNGDFGTPGADNPACTGGNTYPIGFCRLQFPTVIDEIEGTDVDVFGRVFVMGLTDLSGVNDPAPEVIGSVGYGPDGSDPAVDPSWVWTTGTPNPGYGPASPSYEPNNDEYTAVLSVPSPPGNYDFAFRFSGDGGATFTYCDGLAPGSSDGYAPANAGQLTSQPAPPPPPMYFSEYAEGSASNKALEIYNPPGADANLTACEVRFYFNGAMAPTTTIGLSGVLPADDVLVVCDDSIDPALFDPMGCDVLAAGTFYNGDDAIELACGATVLDVIGQIGFDPGAEWANAGVGTQNETLRRSCTVTMGDTNGADAFDPSLEWTSFPQDDFSDFGQYVCP
ncbi:MAG: hypothetical protein KDK70_00065 [Myxococcales bacterium]|nr:hypothetical protein [Myxococcales bacterium]